MNKRQHPQQNRLFLILGLLLILFILIWYGYRHNPKVTLHMCLSDPLIYDGEEINVGVEAKVIKLLPDGFLLKELSHTIRVIGDSQNASSGDFVRMRAVFRKEGYLEVRRLYVAKGRRLKVVVSILPALLVLFLFFKSYRFNWRRMLFNERT